MTEIAIAPDLSWIPTERSLPLDDEKVLAMDSGGHVQELVRWRNLWWFPDKSMYVYYTPKFWKRIAK